MTDPLIGLESDLETQRTYLVDRVPAYARLLELLPDVLAGPRRERLATAWADRRFGAFYERPLLLLSALRDEALLEGASHPLWEAIGADQPSPDGISEISLSAALERERVWRLLAERYVQTNETSRAVAWLWPAALLAQALPGRAIDLVDIGASAGLNLVADRLPAIWVDQGDRPLPTSPLPLIKTRQGFDLRPLDALDPETERWLRACLWPGQRDRLMRLDQSFAAFCALAEEGAEPRVEQSAAAEIPAALSRGAGRFVLAYQSLLRDYLSPEERTEFEAGMLAWLDELPAGGGAWIQLELEGGADVVKPVGLTARVAGDAGAPLLLARCDPHPRSLLVDDEQVERYLRAVA